MKLTGRVLTLTEDANLISAQLSGTAVETEGEGLHYGVNTDAMISGQIEVIFGGTGIIASGVGYFA